MQYRETDFNFVSRLMEEEGIFYFFEQRGANTLWCWRDAASAVRRLPAHGQGPLSLPATGGLLEEDTVAQIEHEYRVEHREASLTDYDFEKPNTSLLATLSGGSEGEDQEGEFYDYPGKYKTKAEGDRYARIRLEEHEVNISDGPRR